MWIAFFVVICAGCVIAFYKNDRNFKNSSEFQSAIEKAKQMRQVFVEVTSRWGGSVMMVQCDIDNPDNVDYNFEKYNRLMYFRVALEDTPWAYIRMVKEWDGSDEIKQELIDKCINNIFEKSAKQLEDVGINPTDVIYNIKSTGKYEGVLYYPFVCPCQLEGTQRSIFIKALKKEIGCRC